MTHLCINNKMIVTCSQNYRLVGLLGASICVRLGGPAKPGNLLGSSRRDVNTDRRVGCVEGRDTCGLTVSEAQACSVLMHTRQGPKSALVKHAEISSLRTSGHLSEGR